MAPGAHLRRTARYSTWNVCWKEGREQTSDDTKGGRDDSPVYDGTVIPAHFDREPPNLETTQENPPLDCQARWRLHCAARDGCLATVKDILAAGANFGSDAVDWALGMASGNGHLEVMRAFIEHGADVNFPDASGVTPLHKAATQNRADAILVLVQAGADVNIGSNHWVTPLQAAIIPEGPPDAIEALLLHGADPNKLGGRGRAPLDLAAQHGRTVVVRFLLEAGADVNYLFGEDKFSALDEAAANDHVDIMAMLIRHGADVNAAALDGRTALHCAARYCRVGAVRVLVEAGASTEAPDSDAYTPLHVASAAAAGSADVVIALLEYGANIEALDSRGRSPLHRAAECGRLAAAKALLAAGADVTLRYGEIERSALDCAAVEGHLGIMRALIEHGVDANAGDSRSANGLHRAGFYDQDGAIDALIGAGAAVDTLDTAAGWTALHYACEKPAPRAVRALLRHGADANAQFDTIGELDSPLHVVAREADTTEAVEVVELLLAWGADETSLNAEGQTAAEIARDVDTDDSEEGSREKENSRKNVERFLGLLANAPANRAWRRRGLLVLCRAYANRVEIDSSGRGVLGDVAARLLGLEEEGLFREIVGCL